MGLFLIIFNFLYNSHYKLNCFSNSVFVKKLNECDWIGNAGKVHGSLARAGKVRGQTPKVAAQDKKKKPRGRAHKRMQYNRRFVTAVVGFGKKRGPNSSEKWGR
jgi:small subunit ribosomal protein S30e